MAIKTNLNIAPYFDDYDISKKYYRVLFKPGRAVQARELTQLQTTLQNQIEQFGENKSPHTPNSAQPKRVGKYTVEEVK